MADNKEIKKIEEFIEKLYEEGKSTDEIKKELINKKTPKEIINQLISLVNKDDVSDNTNKYILSGKSINKLKELLSKRFNTKFFYRMIYSNGFILKEGGLFILVVDYYTLSRVGAVTLTLISEFVKDNCTITSIISGARDPLLKIHMWAISEFENEISSLLKKIATENGWNFKQIKFRKKSLLES